MNNNLALLSKVAYPLHDPAHEVVRAMNAQRITVRLKVPKSANEKARSTNVEFELIGTPSHVVNPHEMLVAAVKKTVDYFNGTRKAAQTVTAKGAKILLLAEAKKADERSAPTVQANLDANEAKA